MIFRPFYYYDLGCAAYLLGCGTLGKCAVVDARTDDVQTYASFAVSKGMRITHVIDTHVHADHRSGGRELAQVVNAAYCLHESAEVSFPFTRLRDGEEVELGNTRLRVLHTPGHSPESICLLGTDLRRGTDPWFVLTGDTLFVGSVGLCVAFGTALAMPLTGWLVDPLPRKRALVFWGHAATGASLPLSESR